MSHVYTDVDAMQGRIFDNFCDAITNEKWRGAEILVELSNHMKEGKSWTDFKGKISAERVLAERVLAERVLASDNHPLVRQGGYDRHKKGDI